jgi:hypothetical protein
MRFIPPFRKKVEPSPPRPASPPGWVNLRPLPARLVPSKNKKKGRVNVPLFPTDIFRAHGDLPITPTVNNELLMTYAVLGGVDGDYNDPIGLLPYPVRVNKYGSIHTTPQAYTELTPYEGTLGGGGDVTLLFAPTPSVTIVFHNDSAANSMTFQTTDVLDDSGNPDFTNSPAAFTMLHTDAPVSMDIQAQGVLVTGTAGDAYRVWVLT